MFRVLVKKQLAEIFKSYFYDAKKNRMRSKWAIAGWIIYGYIRNQMMIYVEDRAFVK